MANPQLEKGYIRIANELWMAISKYPMPDTARRLLMAILFLTYGQNKKFASLSSAQIRGVCNLKKLQKIRAEKWLVEANILGIKNDTFRKKTYCITKDYGKWKRYQKRYQKRKKVSKMIPKTNQPAENKEVTKPKKGIKNDTIQKKVSKMIPKGIKNDTHYNFTRQSLQDNIYAGLENPATSKEKNNSEHMPKTKKESDAMECLRVFGDHFKKKFGDTYIATFKKDITLLKQVISAIGKEKTIQKIKWFFESDDQWLDKAGYTVGTFRACVNKIKKPSILERYL